MMVYCGADIRLPVFERLCENSPVLILELPTNYACILTLAAVKD